MSITSRFNKGKKSEPIESLDLFDENSAQEAAQPTQTEPSGSELENEVVEPTIEYKDPSAGEGESLGSTIEPVSEALSVNDEDPYAQVDDIAPAGKSVALKNYPYDINTISTGINDDFTKANIRQYIENAYLHYAISVVLDRALPYCQDGMKPVQRRILFAMSEMRLDNTAKRVKSARVVGDVLGKYHPHGDSSVYEASVRMEQDFIMRYPLVDGQGNFGSRDGDSAAAMRYTEMRLTAFADLLLAETHYDTVNFIPTYDGSFMEPTLLPARLPMLLLNGSSGVAVGMATNIPSHQINEVGDAAILALNALRHQMAPDFNEVMKCIKGPDFPDGCQITSSQDEIRAAYSTGRGSIRMRARYVVEHLEKGQYRIVITHLPYGVSAGGVCAELDGIANPKAKKDKKMIDAKQAALKTTSSNLIDYIRNESGKDVRIVIDPKSSRVKVDDIMNFLFANTQMESSFPINMTMVGLDSRPKQKNITEMLGEWAKFRFISVTRRVQHFLSKAVNRIHILQGRMIVFLNIDEVIRIIRESDDPKVDLIAAFSLSDVQAEDILEIRLRQLARLEGIKIEKEIKELTAEISGYEALLDDDNKMLDLIVDEVKSDVAKFSDVRLSPIEPVEKRIRVEDTIAINDEPMTVILSKQGWIRSRTGHEVNLEALTYKVTDTLSQALELRSVDTLIVLDTKGRAYSIPVQTIPGGKGEGVPIGSLIELQDGGKVAHIFTGNERDKFVFATDAGFGFTAEAGNLIARNKAGKSFITVTAGAKLLKPIKLTNEKFVACRSSEDKLIVFSIDEIKHLAGGGKGVTLQDIPDGQTLVEILLSGEPASFEFAKQGKRKATVLAGNDLDSYIGKRARKGYLVK